MVEIVALGRLPLFNPDLEAQLPRSIAHFRAQIAAADGLIIASPEYAHGVSGVLKNALDWLVSDTGLSGKPVLVINAAPRAHHADAALREILTTMAVPIVDDLGGLFTWPGRAHASGAGNGGGRFAI